MLIQCAYDLSPCPEQYQQAIGQMTLETWAALGITPEGIATAYTLGFAMVLTPALIGFVVGIVKKLINKL